MERERVDGARRRAACSLGMLADFSPSLVLVMAVCRVFRAELQVPMT